MQPPRRARMLPLALVLCACGRPAAPPREPGHEDAAASVAVGEPAGPADPPADASAEPEPTQPAPAEPEPTQPAPAEPAPAGSPASAQKVTFDDDADPEPTTQIQGAPKRPPMPRFRLFGTRDGDGPN